MPSYFRPGVLRRSLLRLLLLGAVQLVGVAQAAEKPPPLHFGVVSFYNPRLMYLKYQPLVDFLTEQTGRPWELEVSASYEPTVEKLCGGELAAAYLGPFTYVRAHERCGALPVVRLQTHGKASYQSLIMVRSESGFQKLADLTGTTFGFGAPLSTASHLVPRAMLAAAGLALDRDLRCRYLWHHEKAARAVLLGEVDACGVRDIVGEKFTQKGLRILARSEPIPNFPFVVSPVSPPEVREALIRALVILPRTETRVAAAMASWDEELAGGFALASAAEYEPVKALAIKVFGPLVLSLPEAALTCRAPES
ncbi:MAG: phosphate/phosphite/phosphonate ABC transporter substrate-binding protein [Acidobacteriota bacterium]